jgi:hypothetical protein
MEADRAQLALESCGACLLEGSRREGVRAHEVVVVCRMTKF